MSNLINIGISDLVRNTAVKFNISMIPAAFTFIRKYRIRKAVSGAEYRFIPVS